MMLDRLGEIMKCCRSNFGAAPRELSQVERKFFRLQPSPLMRFLFWASRDKLRTVLRDQDALRDHGRVVWGFLVQGNQLLFDPKAGIACERDLQSRYLL